MSSTSRSFFTIVACNYLAYAFVLGDSILKYHPEAEFSIVIVDDIHHQQAEEIAGRGFKAVYPEDLSIANFHQLVFQYNITEASTAIKAHAFEHLYSKGFEQVTYFDPDILCLRRITEVLDGLENHSIVITPHSLSPVRDDTFPTDMMHMFTGVYNLGFIATKSSAVTRNFLSWWKAHLEAMCINAPEMGIFVDQKWIDLAPAFFPEVLILRNPAFNVAYWNLHERTVKLSNNSWCLESDDSEIAFYHFSGVSINNPNGLTKHGTRSPFNSRFGVVRQNLINQPDLQALFEHYISLLRKANGESYTKLPYGYGKYDNGETISQLERALFYATKKNNWQNSNPFEATSNSFWKSCRQSGIRAQKSSVGNLSSTELGSRFGILFRLFEFGIRLLVWAAGPDMYAKFAKYAREQLILHNQAFLIKGSKH